MNTDHLQPETNLSVNKHGFTSPVSTTYVVTSEWGKGMNPVTGEERHHQGIDLVPEHKSDILSVADGIVTFAGVQNGYGNCIEIKHIIDGKEIYSFYAHLSKIEVEVGQTVVVGETIGKEGGDKEDENPGMSTGHHLHFEIRTASGTGHDINPRTYFEF